jgi:hypothetical protein
VHMKTLMDLFSGVLGNTRDYFRLDAGLSDGVSFGRDIMHVPSPSPTLVQRIAEESRFGHYKITI